MARIKPGPGWRRVGGVWEHASGLRVHGVGCCLLPTGEFVKGSEWPESKRLWRYVRLTGQNYKRGLLCWALQVMREREGQANGKVP